MSVRPDRTIAELKELRAQLKVARLHHALGFGNMVTLLKDRKFRAMMEKKGVNVRKFLETTK